MTERSISRSLLPPLIGICGGKGTGKDTVADHLTEVFGYARMAFADPIKKALSTMFNVDEQVFHDPSIKELPLPALMGRSPRYLMQTLGTEWGRDMVISDLWVRLLLLRAEVEKNHRNIVVSDVRFDEEAQAIKDAGGVIWEIIRPNIPYSTGDGHRSEIGISPVLVNVRILNNMDRTMLFTQVGVALANASRKLHRPDDSTSL